jgi:hypothetical protein
MDTFGSRYSINGVYAASHTECKPPKNRDMGAPNPEPLRLTLKQNIAAMSAVKPQGGRRAWAKRIGIGEATLTRMIQGDSDVQLSSVHAVAEGFGLQTWQILVPGLDPGNLPVYIGEAERGLYARWKGQAVETAKVIASLNKPDCPG